MNAFRRNIQIVMLTMFAVVLFAGAALSQHLHKPATNPFTTDTGLSIRNPASPGPVARTRITFSSTRTKWPSTPSGF